MDEARAQQINDWITLTTIGQAPPEGIAPPTQQELQIFMSRGNPQQTQQPANLMGRGRVNPGADAPPPSPTNEGVTSGPAGEDAPSATPPVSFGDFSTVPSGSPDGDGVPTDPAPTDPTISPVTGMPRSAFSQAQHDRHAAFMTGMSDYLGGSGPRPTMGPQPTMPGQPPLPDPNDPMNLLPVPADGPPTRPSLDRVSMGGATPAGPPPTSPMPPQPGVMRSRALPPNLPPGVSPTGRRPRSVRPAMPRDPRLMQGMPY